ncbi:MAG: flagellar basal body rod protein FlgC [Pseudomonadota bacterium]
MSLFNAIDIAATSLDAQSIRLNTISSNLANANAVSSSEDQTYRARYPVFQTLVDDAVGAYGAAAGVHVTGIQLSEQPARREFAPAHPLASDEGFIFRPAVNSVQEVANMTEASRAYQDSIEAMNTVKQLILRTLTLGR